MWICRFRRITYYHASRGTTKKRAWRWKRRSARPCSFFCVTMRGCRFRNRLARYHVPPCMSALPIRARCNHARRSIFYANLSTYVKKPERDAWLYVICPRYVKFPKMLNVKVTQYLSLIHSQTKMCRIFDLPTRTYSISKRFTCKFLFYQSTYLVDLFHLARTSEMYGK